MSTNDGESLKRARESSSPTDCRDSRPQPKRVQTMHRRDDPVTLRLPGITQRSITLGQLIDAETVTEFHHVTGTTPEQMSSGAISVNLPQTLELFPIRSSVHWHHVRLQIKRWAERTVDFFEFRFTLLVASRSQSPESAPPTEHFREAYDNCVRGGEYDSLQFNRYDWGSLDETFYQDKDEPDTGPDSNLPLDRDGDTEMESSFDLTGMGPSGGTGGSDTSMDPKLSAEAQLFYDTMAIRLQLIVPGVITYKALDKMDLVAMWSMMVTAWRTFDSQNSYVGRVSQLGCILSQNTIRAPHIVLADSDHCLESLRHCVRKDGRGLKILDVHSRTSLVEKQELLSAMTSYFRRRPRHMGNSDTTFPDLLREGHIHLREAPGQSRKRFGENMIIAINAQQGLPSPGELKEYLLQEVTSGGSKNHVNHEEGELLVSSVTLYRHGPGSGISGHLDQGRYSPALQQWVRLVTGTKKKAQFCLEAWDT